jgi:acetyl-CoA/propionyl-CoA carboxylase biotin carboxyl carrier protein
VNGAEPIDVSARMQGDRLELHCAGEFRRYLRALDGELWLARDGYCLGLGERPNLLATQGKTTAGGLVLSPMPGTVLMVKVSPGEAVTAGAPLLVVEAMKMEHTVVAPADGVVSELLVQAGQQVALDETLAVVTPQEEQQ